MPKGFLQKCGNPLHGTWTKKDAETDLVNIRSSGFQKHLNAFKKMARARGQTSTRSMKRLDKICISCLEISLHKREFTRELPQSKTENVLIGVNILCFATVLEVI